MALVLGGEREREGRGKRGWWIWLKKIWVVGRYQGHERSYLWTMHWISRVGGLLFYIYEHVGTTWPIALLCFVNLLLHMFSSCMYHVYALQILLLSSEYLITQKEKWITCIWPHNYYKSFFSNGGITLGWYWDHVILSMAH